MLAAGTLFSAVLLRGSDWVLRLSVDKSAMELLYLPLPSRVKFQVKWFIDTVIWRMGDGFAGVTVLLLASSSRGSGLCPTGWQCGFVTLEMRRVLRIEELDQIGAKLPVDYYRYLYGNPCRSNDGDTAGRPVCVFGRGFCYSRFVALFL
jgi:hypothetical protein